MLNRSLLSKVWSSLASRRMLLLPIFTFVVGLCLTILVTSIVAHYEKEHSQALASQRASDVIDRTTLLFSNSILRIQSYDELFDLNRTHLESRIPTLQYALRNTIFKRLTIFRISRPDRHHPENLDLKVTHLIEAEKNNLPVSLDEHMQAGPVRDAVSTLFKTGSTHQTVVHDMDGVVILSVLWKTTLSKDVLFVFSTPLTDLFENVTLAPREKLIVTDPFTTHRWQITTGPIDRAKKAISAIRPAVRRADLRDDSTDAGIKPNFEFISSDPGGLFPLYKLTFLFGFLITCLAVYLLWVLLSQNRKISQLVIQKTYDLEDANNNLHEALMAKARFLANVSHEIRTPLNLILGMIDLAEEKAADEKQRGYLSSIKTAGDHLLGMVEDILDVAKPDTQTVEVRSKKIRTIPFLDEVAKIITPICLESGLRFYLIVTPDLPGHIETDPSRLRQILLNLLRNASKYTPNGHITLRVTKNRLSELTDGIRFEVIDSGLGIPKDRLHQIFEAFFQLESAKILGAGGVGLGLSIVKDLVNQLGGQISVTSRVGKGSNFCVDLALVGERVAPWTQAFHPTFSGQKQIVLVTSDEKLIEATEFIKSFSSLNFKVLTPEQVADFSIDKKDSTVLVLDGKISALPKVMQFVQSLSAEKIICLGDSKEPLSRSLHERVILLDSRPLSAIQLIQAIGFVKKKRDREATAHSQLKLTASIQAPEARQVSVLIADDDAGNRQLFEAYLETLPWSLRFAKDGLEAFDLYIQAPADVLIVDLRMPGLDGFALIERVRAHEKKSALPAAQIILVTADALEETGEKVKLFPGTVYLTKPIRKNQLIGAIQVSARD